MKVECLCIDAKNRPSIIQPQISHKGIGWENFTQAVIKSLNTKKDLIWMIWGKQAEESVGKFISRNHTILRCEHPAAAARGNRQWICNDFSLVNKLLIESKKEPIN